MSAITVGKGRKIKDGNELAILSLGHPGNFVTTAIRELKTEGFNPAHYDLRFAKPLDEALLHEVFGKFNKIITVEDGAIAGGVGSAILEFMTTHKYQCEIKLLGISDHFIEHGTPKELQNECGFDAKGIAAAVRQMLNAKLSVSTFGDGNTNFQ